MIIEYYYKYYFLNTFPIFHILIYFDIPQQFFIAGQPGPWTGPVEAGRGDHGDHGRDEARHRARGCGAEARRGRVRGYVSTSAKFVEIFK